MQQDCCFQTASEWFRYRAAAIIIENNHILLAGNELDDYYYSVGGGVHLGETAEEAVIREVFEETGVRFEIERLAFIHENFFLGSGVLEGKKCHEISLYFLMKPKGTKELNCNSYTSTGAKENVHWIPISELHKYKAFPSFFKDRLFNLKNEVEHIVTFDY